MTLPASVIIPTYNRSSLLGRAIESALASVSPGDEVIVVDDGSTDDTHHVVASFGTRVRAFRTANKGAGAARNRGLLEARHPLVAFLDSDDEWMPDRLTLGRRFLEACPNVLFCFSDFGLRDPGRPDRHNGVAGWLGRAPTWDIELGPPTRYSDMATLPSGRPDFNVHVGDLYGSLLESCGVAVQTLLVRRHGAADALRFPEDLPLFEDWEYAARLARAGKAAFFECETAWQWGHAGPRLTDGRSDGSTAAAVHSTIAERIWADDPDFMAHSGDRVRAVLRRNQLVIAKGLIRRGENAKARVSLRLAEGGPTSYRALASLPGWLTRALFALRGRAFRDAAGSPHQ